MTPEPMNPVSRRRSVRDIPAVLAVVLLMMAAFPAGASDGPPGLVITAAMQYDYARQCLEKKDYETAVVEFKRFVHFFPGHEEEMPARYGIGMALYRQGKFRAAARAFNEIILDGRDRPLIVEACFMQAESFLQIKNTAYAQIVFQNTLKLFTDQEIQDRAHAGLARVYLIQARNMEKGALDAARDHLEMISPMNRQQFETLDILGMISDIENADRKNPVLSGTLSVIPGLGYLYCERFHDAVMTFCLNAGLILAAVKAHEQSNDPLAAVLAAVETGFFSGNVYGAVTAAHKYNRAQRLRILDRYFSIGPVVGSADKSISLVIRYDF